MSDAKPAVNNQPTTKKRDHRLRKIFVSPLMVGFLVTFLFVVAAYNSYLIRNLNDHEKKSASGLSQVFDLVEWAELKSMDLRFRWRGEQEPTAPVALLTIDDRSVEEIGRWPWSREKVASLLEKMFQYGAKAIAVDIIFAEPQLENTFVSIERIQKQFGKSNPQLQKMLNIEKERSQPDLVLAQTIQKYKNKIILGSFSYSEPQQDYLPYQDYCRNEAFLFVLQKTLKNTDHFINSQNSSFILDDNADYFLTLRFHDILTNIFQSIEEKVQIDFLGKRVLENLNFQELNRLHYIRDEEIMNYCHQWLTEKDPLVNNKEFQAVYLQIFSQSQELINLEFPQAVQKFKMLTKSHPVPQKNSWTINTPLIQNNSEFTGSFNTDLDHDGAVRRTPLFFRTGNRVGTSFLPSLSLQTFLVATGYQARIKIDIDPFNNKQKKLTHFEIYDQSKDPEVLYASIPVDGQGRLSINYRGGSNIYTYVPAKELFTDSSKMTVTRRMFNPQEKTWKVSSFEVEKASFIKDKTFVFGATAVGIYDLRVTPFEKNFPGPETHASLIGNLFDRNFISSPANESNWMLVLLGSLGILLTFIYNRVGANLGLLLTAISLSLVIFLDQYLFSKGLFITMVLPFFLILSVYMIMTFYKYFTEERKKKYLRATFSKYVSPAIVDEILKSPEGIELGGKKQRMSIFFSDVRGFTTISETLDPAKLTSVLNRYLTPMTEIVFQNKGTLDKYMGDAVMAFFGAPVFFENHAECACRCALQSLQKLNDIQQEFEKEGLPRIDIGIGINSAEMNVGNMGSNIVRNYTVMGDAVNLGSRLEGITKEYGVRILISEFTYYDVRNKFTCREIDWVRVKGKNKPVRIFELICEGPPSADWKENIHHFNQGYDLYHQFKFEKALECFKLSVRSRGGDKVSLLYIDRCSEYITQPPPENWDGVYNMLNK